MKYYSETLKKLYDTEKDLVQAEGEAKKAELEKLRKEREAKEARATRAKEVEEAIKAADAARVKANQLLSDFTRDYGSFHMSYTSKDAENKNVTSSSDLFKSFNDILNLFLG